MGTSADSLIELSNRIDGALGTYVHYNFAATDKIDIDNAESIFIKLEATDGTSGEAAISWQIGDNYYEAAMNIGETKEIPAKYFKSLKASASEYDSMNFIVAHEVWCENVVTGWEKIPGNYMYAADLSDVFNSDSAAFELLSSVPGNYISSTPGAPELYIYEEDGSLKGRIMDEVTSAGEPAVSTISGGTLNVDTNMQTIKIGYSVNAYFELDPATGALTAVDNYQYRKSAEEQKPYSGTIAKGTVFKRYGNEDLGEITITVDDNTNGALTSSQDGNTVTITNNITNALPNDAIYEKIMKQTSGAGSNGCSVYGQFKIHVPESIADIATHSRYQRKVDGEWQLSGSGKINTLSQKGEFDYFWPMAYKVQIFKDGAWTDPGQPTVNPTAVYDQIISYLPAREQANLTGKSEAEKLTALKEFYGTVYRFAPMDGYTDEMKIEFFAAKDAANTTVSGLNEDQVVALGYGLYNIEYQSQGYNPYTVRFETNGGSQVSDIRNIVSSDGKITAPNTERLNFILEGWFTDSSYTQQWNFDTAVDKDLVLYAKWTPDTLQTEPSLEVPVTVTITGNRISLETSDELSTSAQLMIYGYSRNHKLICYQNEEVEISDEQQDAGITLPDTAYTAITKIFVWEDLESMKPLAKPIVIEE